MRRNEREITEIQEKLEILKKCKVLRLGMCLDNIPYVVPLNYGFEYKDDQLTLYVHGAKQGRKIDTLIQNPQVCFEMDHEHQLIKGDIACRHSFSYESLIGFGTAAMLTDNQDKVMALNKIMEHQTGVYKEHEYQEAHLNATALIQITVSSFTGKRNAS